ncbi:putative Subtilisin-like protease SBT1.4 [Cocos nucifera]|uniref:Putative Subtilisin-like protease SBT1.4 n=1 Tax=Cocos nucifera TaxID=13894 RepID=A0A8K0N795_COCNU|nr:putative Subtilisin-like protease SBT1.4 [Cocos nucifera]
MKGVLLAAPDLEVVAQTTYTPKFLELNQWDSLWHDTTQGEGTIIGVIDSGIIPTHPSFKDDGLPPPPLKWHGRCDFRKSVCSYKLIGAMAFDGGTHPLPLDDDDGHGTHTAGTAAGNFVHDAEVLGMARGTASGMAPRAHLAVYKVLYKKTGKDSDVLAGIDQAISDGVDVLSMSLGLTGSPGLPEQSATIGSFAVIRNGIIPSLCAMNDGPFPSTVVNDFPWAPAPTTGE